MTYALDTSAVVGIIRGKSHIERERLRTATNAQSTITISTVAVYELWVGAFKSERPEHQIQLIKRFLAGNIDVVPFDEESAMVAGKIRAELESAGAPIGPYDILIAAQALASNAILVTSNQSEFGRVTGLRWEDWSA